MSDERRSGDSPARRDDLNAAPVSSSDTTLTGSAGRAGGLRSMFGPPPRPGLIGVIDHFEVVKLLGQGGMGAVYLARDTITSARVAIKLLSADLARDPQAVRHFLAEATSMARLSHHSILPVLSVSPDPAKPYYVMRYVEPGPLSRAIKPNVPLDTSKSLGVATAVAEALVEVHRHGLLHRDLKPANVLLDESGHAYLADFGLVRNFVHDSLAVAGQSHCVGTAPYMSPLIAAGQAEDTRADIYSFGATLYEMLTGCAPYSGPTASAVLDQIRVGPPPPVLARNPAAPRGLAAITEAAMARELRDRYAQMADVLADLRRVATGQPPAGPHETRAATAPRRKLPSLLLAGAASIVLIVMGVILWNRMHPTPPSSDSRQRADLGLRATTTANGAVSPPVPSTSTLSAPPAPAGVPVAAAPATVPTTNAAPATAPTIIAAPAVAATTAPAPSGTPGEFRAFVGHENNGRSHQGNVMSVAFSPDGTSAVSGGDDKTVRLWDVATGKELRTFKAPGGDTSHDDLVRCVAFSGDGQHVASCSDDQTIRIWDVETGRMTRSMTAASGAEPGGPQPAPRPNPPFVALAWWGDGNGVVSVSRNAVLRWWDSSQGAILSTNRLFPGPEGRFAVSGRGDLDAWSVPDDPVMHVGMPLAKEVLALKGAHDSMITMVFTADGRRAAATTGPGDQPIFLRIWDTEVPGIHPPRPNASRSGGDEIRHIPGRHSMADAIALSPDGRLIVGAGLDQGAFADCALRVWDVETGKLLWESAHLNKQPLAIAVSPDGRTALAAGDDGVLRLWRLPPPLN